MKRVLVFGSFDMLHPGHLNFLKQARRKGRWLIASVARDNYIRKQKNREPYHREGERIALLLETGLVNEAYLSDEDVGSFQILSRSNPDIVCFGHDQHALHDFLVEWLKQKGLLIPTYVMDSYHPDRFKSSKIIPGNSKTDS